MYLNVMVIVNNVIFMSSVEYSQSMKISDSL